MLSVAPSRPAHWLPAAGAGRRDWSSKSRRPWPCLPGGHSGLWVPRPHPPPVKSLFPSSLLLPATRDEGSGSRGPGHRRDFQSSSHPVSPDFTRSSHLTPSAFKSFHAAEKKRFLLEKVQFRSVVKIQQLVGIKFAHFRVIVGELGYILEG